jgi:hypothetical protein
VTIMTIGAANNNSEDIYLGKIIERTCAKIVAAFPSATFEIGAHPHQRGAIIDAHVPTDDDFAVLDLVNPELDDLLMEEEIAVYVRVLGPQSLGERS